MILFFYRSAKLISIESIYLQLDTTRKYSKVSKVPCKSTKIINEDKNCSIVTKKSLWLSYRVKGGKRNPWICISSKSKCTRIWYGKSNGGCLGGCNTPADPCTSVRNVSFWKSNVRSSLYRSSEALCGKSRGKAVLCSLIEAIPSLNMPERKKFIFLSPYSELLESPGTGTLKLDGHIPTKRLEQLALRCR